MEYIKTYESKLTESISFKEWFKGSKITDKNGNPLVVYHGTNNLFSKFRNDASPGGITWFSTSEEHIKSGESGAAGCKYIVKMYVSMKNPAGWYEYEKLGLQQIIDRGYDGVILPFENHNPNDDYDGFVFNAKQIKIIK